MANCADNSYTIYYTTLDFGSIQIRKSALITQSTPQNPIAFDIALIGKTRLEYGEIFNENMLHILERFAVEEDEDNPGNPDLTQTFANLLGQPTTGQIWYNKTKENPYIWNGSEWVPLAKLDDVAGNSGVIKDGCVIPLPQRADGTYFNQDECVWTVSPFYFESKIDYVVCYADTDRSVVMQYRLEGVSSDIVHGYANYQILCMTGNENLGNSGVCSVHPTPTPTNIPSPTPAPSVTPTGTPASTPGSTPAPSPSPIPPTPGASNTPTPSVTLSPQPSPIPPTPGASNTPAPSQTGTPAVTPTGTPPNTPAVTPTGTPAVTPTSTPEPSVTSTPVPPTLDWDWVPPSGGCMEYNPSLNNEIWATFRPDGTASFGDNLTNETGTWLPPGSNISDWEISCTYNLEACGAAGSVTMPGSSSFDTNLSLTEIRSWVLHSNMSIGGAAGTMWMALNIELHHIPTGTTHIVPSGMVGVYDSSVSVCMVC